MLSIIETSNNRNNNNDKKINKYDNEVEMLQNNIFRYAPGKNYSAKKILKRVSFNDLVPSKINI